MTALVPHDGAVVPGAALDSWVRDRFGVRLQTGSSPVGWQLTDLVGVALRRNPRRAHLLVSTVLGKHVPVDPRLVRGAGRLLGVLVARAIGTVAVSNVELTAAAAALLDGDQSPLDALVAGVDAGAVVFGFAETATGLGHCVAEALSARWYLHSTRRLIDAVPVSARFEEGHSHATSHLVQPNPPGLLTSTDVCVLVDDELSTGSTAMSAIADLHAVAPRSHYVIAALIDLRSDRDAAALDAFAARLGCEIDVMALVSGQVGLPAGLTEAAGAYIAAQPAAVPVTGSTSEVARVQLPWPQDLPEGGRHGLLGTEFAAYDAAVTAAGAALVAALPGTARNVLVLGTEELMYLPLRLAGHLADQPGFAARYQTTTRSPVHAEISDGYPVNRAFSFPSPEGEPDVPRYLYNADWRSPDGRRGAAGPDAVVVVTDPAMDTPALHAPDGLLAQLTTLGAPVVLAVVPGCDASRLAARR